MPATITRRLVAIKDAADALAVSTRTVRRYIADGQLDAVRLGRKTLRIKIDSIALHRRQAGGRLAATVKRGQTGLSLFPNMFPETERAPRKGL